MEGSSSSTSATSAGQSAGSGAAAAATAEGATSVQGAESQSVSETVKTEAPQLKTPDAEKQEVKTDVSPETVAEKKAEEKKLHAFIERMAKLTSKQYNTADEALDDAEEHWTKNEQVIENYKKDDEIVFDVVKANPKMAKIIFDMHQGIPFEVAAALHYDKDAFVPPEGSDNHKAWAENVEKRKQMMEKHDALMKTIDANLAETDKSFMSFVTEKKLDEAGTTALRSFINGLLDKAYHGQIDAPIFEMGYNLINKDKMLQEARESGEISARNEKIEVVKQKLDSKGDDMPHLNPSATEVVEEKKPEIPTTPFERAIDSFNQKRRRFPE